MIARLDRLAHVAVETPVNRLAGAPLRFLWIAPLALWILTVTLVTMAAGEVQGVLRRFR